MTNLIECSIEIDANALKSVSYETNQSTHRNQVKGLAQSIRFSFRDLEIWKLVDFANETLFENEAQNDWHFIKITFKIRVN